MTANTWLNLDGNKFSSTVSQFIPKPVKPLDKKAMDETRLNMRGSHFSVGVSNDNHMQPAPYKVSNPANAELVKPIDGAALRKESWILGQCPDTYHSIQRSSFKSPGTDAETKRRDNKAAQDLRARVAGTSIKNESPSGSTDARLAF